MYVRTLEGHLAPERADDAINYFRQSVAPALRRQPGFVSGRWLDEPTGGTCLLLVLWESAQDQQQADQNPLLQTLLGHLGVYFVDPPIRRSYELKAQIS